MLVNTVLSNGLNFHWKIGRKDPRHQLSVEETLSKIEEAIAKIGSEKVVIEANEGISAGIYDERGSVKWNFVGALTSKYPPPKFIFECPIESQQSALIAEFGQRVNLVLTQMIFHLSNHYVEGLCQKQLSVFLILERNLRADLLPNSFII